MHAKANEIVQMARSFEHLPYRHQGRNEFGMDCIGVPFIIMHYHNLSQHEVLDYPRRPNAREFKRHLILAGFTPIAYRKREHGDLLQMQFNGWPVHCGIVDIDQGYEYLIHAMLTRRKVVRELFTEVRDARVSTAWRFPGDVDG